jgi:hypothetical protein
MVMLVVHGLPKAGQNNNSIIFSLQCELHDSEMTAVEFPKARGNCIK